MTRTALKPFLPADAPRACIDPDCPEGSAPQPAEAFSIVAGTKGARAARCRVCVGRRRAETRRRNKCLSDGADPLTSPFVGKRASELPEPTAPGEAPETDSIEWTWVPEYADGESVPDPVASEPTAAQTILGRVCRDPKCHAGGAPQPIEVFQPHPRGRGLRMRVCRTCVKRKAWADEGPLPRATEPPEDVEIPVYLDDDPPEVAPRLAPKRRGRPPIRDRAQPTDALSRAVEALRVGASGRPDGRTDLPPVWGPRSVRAYLREALDGLGA